MEKNYLIKIGWAIHIKIRLILELKKYRNS